MPVSGLGRVAGVRESNTGLAEWFRSPASEQQWMVFWSCDYFEVFFGVKLTSTAPFLSGMM
jgi:hypothetical protein